MNMGINAPVKKPQRATEIRSDVKKPATKGHLEAQRQLDKEARKRINFNVPVSIYNDFREKLESVSRKEGRAVQQTDILTPLIETWIKGEIEVKPGHSRQK